jgi:hypothetical protein
VTLRATCRHCGADGEIGRSIAHRAGCPMYQGHPHEIRDVEWPPPVVPTCPDVCAFRGTCATSTQQGIRSLWDAGRIRTPQECTFYERRAQLHYETTGRTVPATAAELLAQLRERAAIAGEGTP